MSERYEKNESISLINSDCLTALKDITSQSVDLILTDPPYNLGLFMQNRDTNLKKMRDNFLERQTGITLIMNHGKHLLKYFLTKLLV